MEAIECMQEDDLLQKALGEHVYEKYITAKTLEWDRYRTQVHPYEIQSYLSKY